MGEKTEKIERIEKNKGKTMNEIILDMEKGTGSSSQVSRILDNQTEMLAKRLERSNMEQLMAESERKRIEEENRLKAAQKGEMPPTPPPQQAPQEAKNILEAVKVGLEAGKPQQQSQGSVADMAKSIVEAIKIGVDMGKAQTPQAPKESHTEKYLDLLFEELKLSRQEQSKEREARLEKEITELKNKPGLMDELTANAEKVQTFGKIFGNPGGKTEIDLKLQEMGQVERLENRRIDWEQQKHQEDKEGEKELYGLIGKAIDGPIADLTKSLGGAAAHKIEAGIRNPNTRNPNNPQLTQIPCPQCNKPFSIITGAQQVVCPNPDCNAILGLQQSPPPQQAQSPPAQTQEQQPSETTQQTKESDQQPEQQHAEAPEPVQSEQPNQQ